MTTTATPRVLIVSHTHWDREWYRTFERFRARLVDVVDRVLRLVAEDPGYHFVLDGQTIVLEDYLEIRPERRADLVDAIRSGRVGVGPWYVQPDSLLPAGETHIRNLAMGRRVAQRLGVDASRVAYTPDSFGHPAMFPAIFSGFGLGPFVYWRGNGVELDELGPRWRWVAPDDSAVACLHLGEGYFAAGPTVTPVEPGEVAAAMEDLARRLSESATGVALLMNGADHTLPDEQVGPMAAELANRTGWTVQRGRFDELPALLDATAAEAGEPREFSGDLLGGRVANLLPGVWSARMWIKRSQHLAEAALLRRLEPLAAASRLLGLPDEAPTIERGWRTLLANCAHDSICGCSIDRVHRQMAPRYESVVESADATVERIAGAVCGQSGRGNTPWADDLDIAVFNPAPRPRTVIARVPLDGFPLYGLGVGRHEVHPLALATLAHAGFTVDGVPARLVERPASDDPVRMIPEQTPGMVEFPVTLPAFGWRSVRLTPGAAAPDEVDEGRTIEADGGRVAVAVADDGTLDVRLGDRRWRGLFGLEDQGDAGDTYDADPEPAAPVTAPTSVTVERRRHGVGIAELRITRVLLVPAALADDGGRSTEEVELPITTVVRVADGFGRVEVDVEVDNRASDHRLRLAFPTGAPTGSVTAATTLGVATRPTHPADAEGWIHPPPTTFPHHGWVAANGLCIAAPGLPEAEARPDGTVLITLLRSVGWLSRIELRTRPVPAGPTPATPEAQCPGVFRATFALLPEAEAHLAADLDAEPVLVPAGTAPRLPEGVDGLSLEPSTLTLSTFAPDPDGDGVVVRVLNTGDESVTATVRMSAALAAAVGSVTSVRLDGTPDAAPPVAVDDGVLRCTVAPRGMRTLRLTLRRGSA